MKLAGVLLTSWLGTVSGIAGAAEPSSPPLPDPDYCARRDADPEKCVIRDGPPRKPIVRNPQKPLTPPPADPAPPEKPAPKPLGKS
jgi:hypothetical protein